MKSFAQAELELFGSVQATKERLAEKEELRQILGELPPPKQDIERLTENWKAFLHGRRVQS